MIRTLASVAISVVAAIAIVVMLVEVFVVPKVKELRKKEQECAAICTGQSSSMERRKE